MDPIFLPFQPSNGGIPQESKLATYMKPVESINSNIPTLCDNETLAGSYFSSFGLSGASRLTSSTPYMGILSNRVGLDSPQSLNASPSTTPHSSPPPASQVLGSCSPSIEGASVSTTYQENVGGTTYFFPRPTNGDLSSNGNDLDVSMKSDVSSIGYQAYPGTPSHLTTLKQSKAGTIISSNTMKSVTSSPGGTTSSPTTVISDLQAQMASNNYQTIAAVSSFFIGEEMRLEIMKKNALTLAQNTELNSDIPKKVDIYEDLVPLEPMPSKTHHLIGYVTSTYKATNSRTGVRYCLRRVHNFRLQHTKCMMLVDMWKRLNHSNIVQLREVFTTKAFADNSIVFVYDFHPGAETLLVKHFTSKNDACASIFSDPRSIQSKTAATMLRQQQNKLPESVIWNYVVQLTSALRVMHSEGLACRALDASKVILTGNRSRIRISGLGLSDVLLFDNNCVNPLSLVPHFQQEDLVALGKLVLSLATKSTAAVQRENISMSLELVSRQYSPDLKNLIVYLLSNQTRKNVNDLMPMIGARFYAQLDSLQLRYDLLENEVGKEMENGRLLRLMAKLGSINERPEFNIGSSWSETGDRYLLKLFRDYVFHQVNADGRPWLDLSHVIHCLNKLDAGVAENVQLTSRDGQCCLIVSYSELKKCLEQSFNELVSASDCDTSKDSLLAV